MIRHNLKNFAWMIVVLTITTFVICIVLKGVDLNNPDFRDIWSSLGQTVLVVSLYAVLFNHFLWKCRIFRWAGWLVKTPILQGKWSGTLKYFWDDRWQEKPMSMKIKQTFLHIQVYVQTNESWSKSIGSSFDVDEDNGFNSIIYTYLNTPNASVREHSPIHYGTAILSIQEDGQMLLGNYYTDRKSCGEMTLKRAQAK